jgi:hypothetical protein
MRRPVEAVFVLSVLICGTLLGGSVEVVKTLAVSGAIPFALLLLIAAFLRTLRDEEGPAAAARPRQA